MHTGKEVIRQLYFLKSYYTSTHFCFSFVWRLYGNPNHEDFIPFVPREFALQTWQSSEYTTRVVTQQTSRYPKTSHRRRRSIIVLF